MKKIIFIFSILLSFNLNAAFVDGNQLYSWLESHKKMKNLALTGNDEKYHVVESDHDNLRLLAGYLQGVVDSRNHSYFCLDDGVSLEQMVDIIYADIKLVPQLKHIPGDTIITGSLTIAFPCPDDKK